MAGADAAPGRSPYADRVPPTVRRARWSGAAFRLAVTGAGVAVVALVVAFLALLGSGAEPALARAGFGFLTGAEWDLARGTFGAGPAIVGTLLTSALALLLAVPLSLGVAIFSSEIAPRRWRAVLAYVVDLGAAIPSVVYGFWAVVILVPFMRVWVEPALAGATGRGPGFGGPTLGSDVLTAAVILAIMVIPTISALAREALRAVPRERREAALSLGATRAEVTRIAVLGPATPGLLAAVILGLGRALGETIAVVLVIGNLYQYPSSLFSSGSTIPSWIVNEFDNSFGVARSGLYALGVTLFVISLAINVGARLVLARPSSAEGLRPRRLHRQLAAPRRTRPTAPTVAPESPAWWDRARSARPHRLRRRRSVDLAVSVGGVAAVVAAVYPLVSLVRLAIGQGGAAVVRPSFYTSPLPPQCYQHCSLGGIAPPLQGTVLLVGTASLIGVPVGLLVGIYLAEYARGPLGRAVRLVVDAMVGIPSILIGVFVFALFLDYARSFAVSATSAAVALSLLMIPLVAQATAAALATVAPAVRESALALGFPRHRITTRIVLGSCRSAIVTGVLLAVGRAGGETAALLFTAGWTQYGFAGWNQPVSALAPFIFQALINASVPNWTTDAWGAALVLLLLMLGVSLASRLSLRTAEAAAE